MLGTEIEFQLVFERTNHRIEYASVNRIHFNWIMTFEH